ncbi:hypothetical protein Tco_0385018, partial [Tanacetum coccineum]
VQPQIERYLKPSISGIHWLQTTAEIVKRWSNEVQEAIQSRSAQFQAHALLHQGIPGIRTWSFGWEMQEQRTVNMSECHVAGCHWTTVAACHVVGPTCHVIADVAATLASRTHLLMWQLP